MVWMNNILFGVSHGGISSGSRVDEPQLGAISGTPREVDETSFPKLNDLVNDVCEMFTGETNSTPFEVERDAERHKNQKKMSESKPEEDSNQNPRVTWEGCSVLLDINDGDRLVFARLTPGSRLTLGNKECSLQPLIGCPFGLLFQAENGEKGLYLSRVLPTAEGGNLQEKRETNETKDNRALVDNNTAQNLTGEDIDALRRQGASGDEIVEALIANSATYENKTSFSQEKYRLKKQKKYAPKVLLRRPFARSICETYFKKYPDRIGFLRVDSLSVLLSMANVTANSDVLVVDKIGGILTGAVAERLGGTGYVCNTYRGVTPPSIDIVRIFNFSTEICKRIVQSPLQDLCSAQKESEQIQDANKIKSQTDEAMLSPSASPPQVFVSNEETMDKDTTTKTSTTCKKAAKAGQKASPEAIKLWRDNGFSSLVIAAPDIVDGADLWSFAKEVIPLLSFSAPFAIYHQCEQPLIKCMRELQQNKMAINLQLSEPWLREYQVLPSRTHPLMQMSGSGGYILSGTRIATDSN